MADNPKYKLWKALNDADYYTKSYDDFDKQFSSDEGIAKLHGALQSAEYYTKDIQSFKSQFFKPASYGIQLPGAFATPDTSTPMVLTQSGKKVYDRVLQDEENKTANLSRRLNGGKQAYDAQHGAGASDAIIGQANERLADTLTEADDNRGLANDIVQALKLPALNKGVSDTVLRPLDAGATFVDDVMGKIYTGITGKAYQSQKANWFKDAADSYDKQFEQRSQPETIAGHVAEGVMQTVPLLAATALTGGENLVANGTMLTESQSAPVISHLTKFLATTGALKGYGEARNEGKDMTESLGNASEGFVHGGIEGMSIEAQMLVGKTFGKEAANLLAQKGLFKGGEVTKALLNALGVSAVFGGTSVGSDLVNGREINWDNAAVQAGMGAAFEAPGIVTGTGREISKIRLDKSILSTLTDARDMSRVANFIKATPEQIGAAVSIKDRPGKLIAKSIEQGMQAGESADYATKTQGHIAQLSLQNAADLKIVVGQIGKNKQKFIESINNSDLPEDTKNQLLGKVEQVYTAYTPIAKQQADLSEQIKGMDDQIQGYEETIKTSADPLETANAEVRLEALKERRNTQFDKLKKLIKDNPEVKPEQPEPEVSHKHSFDEFGNLTSEQQTQRNEPANETVPAAEAVLPEQKQPEEAKAAAEESAKPVKIGKASNTLKDVESTAKALGDVKFDLGQNDEYSKYGDVLSLVPDYEAKQKSKLSEEVISEAYHKAKADGSNPELVKAVEDLLGEKGDAEGAPEQSYVKEKIGKLFDLAQKVKDRVVKEFIRPVTKEEVKAIKEKTGIDIDEEFEHTIDNSAINHILKEHGNESTEAKQGQTAITKDDVSLIPDIIDNYDAIEKKIEPGKPERILYTKGYPDGTTYYFEEVRTGKKELAAVTMYKKKGNAKMDTETVPLRPTSETTPTTNIEKTDDKSIKELLEENFDAVDEDVIPEGAKRAGQKEYRATTKDGYSLSISPAKEGYSVFLGKPGKDVSNVDSFNQIESWFPSDDKELLEVIAKSNQLIEKRRTVPATKDVPDTNAGDKEPVKATGTLIEDVPQHLTDAGYQFAAAPAGEGKFAVFETNSGRKISNNFDSEAEAIKAFQDNKDKLTVEAVANKTGAKAEGKEEPGELEQGAEQAGTADGRGGSVRSAEEGPEKTDRKVKSLTDEELARKKELGAKFRGRFNDITGIPALLADKEFREYAGLILKEAKGDFKQWARDMIDNVGSKIEEHLPALYKSLTEAKEPNPEALSKEEAKAIREDGITPEDIKAYEEEHKSAEATGVPEPVPGPEHDRGSGIGQDKSSAELAEPEKPGPSGEPAEGKQPEREQPETESANQPTEQKAKPEGDGENLSGSERKKALLNRLADPEQSNLSETTIENIKKKGLGYEAFSNEEANLIAKDIISFEGVDRAVEMADNRANDLNGAVRTMLYSEAINHYYESEKSAKTDAEKTRASDLQADLSDRLDIYLRDSGRSIQAVQRYYRMSPDGIYKSIKRRIEREDLTEKKIGKGNLSEKISSAAEQLIEGLKKQISDLEKKLSEKTKKTTGESNSNYFTRTREERLKRIADAKERFKKASKGTLSSSIIGLNQAQVEAALEIGAEYAALGFTKFADWSRKMINELDLTEKQARALWSSKLDAAIDNKQRTLRDFAGDEFDVEFKERLNQESKKLIDKLFPPTIIERTYPKAKKARAEIHEKIVDAIQAGVLDGTIQNVTDIFGEAKRVNRVDQLFYEKFGIVHADNPDVARRLKELSAKVAETEPGSLYQAEAYIKLNDYIANLKKESLLNMGIPVMYANMLYGIETHQRNMGFNAQVVLQKFTTAALRNPKYVSVLWNALKKGTFERGSAEARNVLATGYPKTGTVPKERDIMERIEKRGLARALMFYNYPGRALSAADAFLNYGLREMKTAELLINGLKEENKKLPRDQRKTNKQIEAEVNDLLSYTTLRRQRAEQQAMRETMKYYNLSNPVYTPGADGLYTRDRDTGYSAEASRNFKRRVFELMEQERDSEVVAEAKDFADSSLVMGPPKGYAGIIANGIQTLFGAIPPLRVTVAPFVNVPLNVANHMIEYSPLGFITLAAGKEANLVTDNVAHKFGVKKELSAERKKELLIKASVGTAILGAMYGLTGLTYTDDKGKKRPVLTVFADGTGDYNKNRELANTDVQFEEYTADFMGQKFSYKYSPFAPAFAAIGYWQDNERFKNGNDKAIAEKLSVELYKYMGYVFDQASLTGIADLFNVGNRYGNDDTQISAQIKESLSRTGKRSLRTLLFPNFIPQINTDVKGLLELDNKRAMEGWDEFNRGIPMLEQQLVSRHDQFGRPVKDRFNIPWLPAQHGQIDEYTNMLWNKGYWLKPYTDRTYFDGDVEHEMSKREVYEIDRLRGQYVLKQLENTEPVVYDAEDNEVTVKEYLNWLNKQDFKEAMNALNLYAVKMAKNQVLGAGKWSNTAKKNEEPTDEELDQKSALRSFKAYLKDLLSESVEE